MMKCKICKKASSTYRKINEEICQSCYDKCKTPLLDDQIIDDTEKPVSLLNPNTANDIDDKDMKSETLKEQSVETNVQTTGDKFTDNDTKLQEIIPIHQKEEKCIELNETSSATICNLIDDALLRQIQLIVFFAAISSMNYLQST